ncbi:hypothetical protein EXIGLDRAFT_749985 [Exidia glandulosa HHB12029]|uniref:C2H2-type domain-containing protein n=1 Tax=Exidia glandulosa HHB12029 TaxID=1314781 RepID=A0A165HCK8_EXIGL|nr:hypothetical protein EXIGLDRAFT_749985 [Exidia glandulosa HHB12029]
MSWFPVGLSTLLTPSAFVLPPLDIDDHGDNMFGPLSWQTELVGDAMPLRGYQSLDVIRMTPSQGLYDDFAAPGILSPSASAVMMPDVTHWIPNSEIVGSSPSPRESAEPWWTEQGTTPPSAASTVAPQSEKVTTKREPSPDIPLLTPPRTPSPTVDAKHHILTGGGHDPITVKSEFESVPSAAAAESGYPSPLLSPTSTVCGSLHDDASFAVTADRDCDLGLDTYNHDDHGVPLQLFGPSFLVVHKPCKRSSSPTSCVALAPPSRLSDQGLLEQDIKYEDDAHDAPLALPAPTRKRTSARMEYDEAEYEPSTKGSRKRKAPAAGRPSASAASTLDTIDSADGERDHDDRPLKKLKKEISYDDANHVLSPTPPPLRIKTDLDPRSKTAPEKVASFACLWGMCPQVYPRRDLRDRHVHNDHDLRRCSSCGSSRGSRLSCASGLCVARETEGDSATHSQPMPK